MLVFFLLPVVPQHFEALGNLAVIGDHDAAIAVSSQIFPGVKTKSRGVSQRSNPLALVARAMSLAGVFDHHQPVLVGKLSDGIHVGGVPVQMHGNNGFGAARDGSLDRLYVQRVRVWIDVHQYRCGPGMRYAERGGDEAVGRSDDLVARANVESPQRQLEGRCAGVHTDRIGRVTESGKLLLEQVHLAPQDEVCLLDYLRNRLINFRSDGPVLGS